MLQAASESAEPAVTELNQKLRKLYQALLVLGWQAKTGHMPMQGTVWIKSG
jgi:hypothetical protein